MEVSQLMAEGVNLLIVGMGTVFVFLAVMVIAVSLMSKLAHRIEDLLPVSVESVRESSDGTSSAPVAVISAAVHRYTNGPG